MWSGWLLVLLVGAQTWSVTALFAVGFPPDPPPPVHVSCKNKAGKNVDWFVLYKAPILTKNGVPLTTGLEYIYIDANGKTVMSPTSRRYKPIDDDFGVLGHTLRPMLRSARHMPHSFGFLSYNDHPPGADAKPHIFGLSKGVVLGDTETNTGLWLSHSTPQFPVRRVWGSFWPKSGTRNGQTFICVSLTLPGLSIVGEHLKNIRAFPFDYDLPLGFPHTFLQLAYWETSDNHHGVSQTLRTINKKELSIMAKMVDRPTDNDVAPSAAVGDLYVKLAAGLNSNVNAQTGVCQRGQPEKSYCVPGARSVMKVENITTELGFWSTRRDNSKWAVTVPEPWNTKSNWTCFGDTKRSESQFRRWGGAVCINDQGVNEIFRQYVTDLLPCGQDSTSCDHEDY